LRDRSRIRSDLILLLVALIWGSAFVAQRYAALQMGALLFNAIRFWIGTIILVPFLRLGFHKPDSNDNITQHDILWISLAGFLLFGGAALQQVGMKFTTAGNAGFITGLYVVLIPFFMSMIWREKIRATIWLAAALSVAGLFLLSTGGKLHLNPGDVLELLGAGFWAFHVILIGRLVQRVTLIKLAIGQYLVCGLLSLAASLLVEQNSLSNIASSWWALIYTGVISIGMGYTLQIVGQRFAPAPDAAIILSLEAVFAAFFGWFFLGELLNGLQILGCIIIFSGILMAQAHLFISEESLL
jgi:drug/metabolite transporter (DMT)-like permease